MDKLYEYLKEARGQIPGPDPDPDPGKPPITVPGQEELEQLKKTLERLNWQVDYIITHCAPTAIQRKLNASFKPDKLTDFLEKVRCRSQFHYWLFGHYHDNRIINDRYILQWEQISGLEI